jgi:pimeloyl-ACP methyl ester carboxylesterase
MRALLLPGMDGTGKLFAKFCRALPASIRPVIASYGELATYEAILETIAIPDAPFAIVAESFAGPLALRLAQRAPVPPRAVVLVASFVCSPRAFPRWLASLLPGLFAIPPPPALLRRWMLGEDASTEDVAELRDVLASVRPAAALRPDVEVALLDASHLVLQRKPAEAADLILSFLDRCS